MYSIKYEDVVGKTNIEVFGEEKEIEKQKNILRTIIDAVPETIFYKDREGKFIGYNKNFEEFYKKRGITEIYHDKAIAKQFKKTRSRNFDE